MNQKWMNLFLSCKKNYEDFKSEFEAFFPTLEKHCKDWLEVNQ